MVVARSGPGVFSAIASVGSICARSGSNGLFGRAAICASSPAASRAYPVRSAAVNGVGRPADRELLVQQLRSHRRDDPFHAREPPRQREEVCLQGPRRDDVHRQTRGAGVGLQIRENIMQSPVARDHVNVNEYEFDVGRIGGGFEPVGTGRRRSGS